MLPEQLPGPEPLRSCPQCRGTGWEFVQGKGVRRCGCRRSTTAVNSAARVPKRYETCSFDSYYPLNPSQEAALTWARYVVDCYPKVEIGLLFIGTCGVGKTHLSVAILKALLAKNVPCLFYDFRDLLAQGFR